MGRVLITVGFTERCEELLRRLEIPRSRLTDAVNDRHVGLVTEGLLRTILLQWPSAGVLTLVDGLVTKTAPAGTGIRVLEVKVDLALELRPRLPGGVLTRDMTLDEVLDVVARGFGYRVTCSPAVPATYVYSGPWDGQPPRVDVQGETGEGFLAATFMPESASCEYVWCFNIDRYLAWFTG